MKRCNDRTCCSRNYKSNELQKYMSKEVKQTTEDYYCKECGVLLVNDEIGICQFCDR